MSGPRGVTPERLSLAAKAASLRSEGLVWREIAERLGVSRSYANDLVNDPDGSKSRARKDSYRGECVDCGAPTSGSNGREQAPERCDPCSHALQHAEAKWTRESIIDAIQRFAFANGRPPLADEWITVDNANGYPPRSAVYQSTRGETWQPFPKWADAIEAAGFPRPKVGNYTRRPRGTQKRGPEIHTPEGRKLMRDYIVLELDPDGRWIEHPAVQAYSEALAIETLAGALGEMNGRAAHKFIAVSKARWIVRELQPVTSFKAVAVSPDKEKVT